MKVIFGTTNERKVEDLRNISKSMNLDLEIIGMHDISWDRGEIEENGTTIFENSLIKAKAIHEFCHEHNIDYPIITDDAGLFVDALNGEPGIYTARYADEELSKDSSLPKYECINKLLRNMEGVTNRRASYRCVVTCMDKDGNYFQEEGISIGYISEDIIGTIKKPYFYAIFVLENFDKSFSELNEEELKETYRFQALRKFLTKISK